MTVDIDDQEIPTSTQLIIKCLKDELNDKFSLTENHVIKIFIYEKKPKLTFEEAQERNKESIKKSLLKYKENNLDMIRERARAYYYKNKEELSKKNREYYQQHKEKYRAKWKEYYEKNKEQILAKNRAREKLLKNKEKDIQ